MVLLTSTFFLSFLSSVSSLSSVFCSFSLYLLTVFLLLTFSFQFNFCFSLLQLSLHVSISPLCSLLYLLPLFYFTSFLLVLVSVFSPIPHSIFSYFPSFLTVPHLNIGIVHFRLFTLSLSLFLFFGFFLSWVCIIFSPAPPSPSLTVFCLQVPPPPSPCLPVLQLSWM